MVLLHIIHPLHWSTRALPGDQLPKTPSHLKSICPSPLLTGQVWRKQGEEAAAELKAGPDILRQPSAGEDPGQRVSAFLRAAAQLEQRTDRPLPVQPADVHDKLQQQPPVCGVKEESLS